MSLSLSIQCLRIKSELPTIKKRNLTPSYFCDVKMDTRHQDYFRTLLHSRWKRNVSRSFTACFLMTHEWQVANPNPLEWKWKLIYYLANLRIVEAHSFLRSPKIDVYLAPWSLLYVLILNKWRAQNKPLSMHLGSSSEDVTHQLRKLRLRVRNGITEKEIWTSRMSPQHQSKEGRKLWCFLRSSEPTSMDVLKVIGCPVLLLHSCNGFCP